MLFAVLRVALLEPLGQPSRIAAGQIGQVADALAHQQVAALAADAAHLAEVPLGGRHLIAGLAPAAEGAFLAVADQARGLAALQVGGEALQALVELALQAAAQGQRLLLQLAPPTGHHQAMADRSLLQGRQQPAPKGQLQPMLAGHPITLARQHGPVAPGPPAAGAGGALQQRRMGLERHSRWPLALEPQADHGFGSGLTGGEPVSGPQRDQRLKALHLLLQGQSPVRTPLALLSGAMLVKPGPAPAAHPAAQQAIGQQHGVKDKVRQARQGTGPWTQHVLR